MQPDGAAITVPVTVAFGSRDRVLLPKVARRRDQLPDQTRWVTLFECGHIPMFDDPAATADLLLQARDPATAGTLGEPIQQARADDAKWKEGTRGTPRSSSTTSASETAASVLILLSRMLAGAADAVDGVFAGQGEQGGVGADADVLGVLRGRLHSQASTVEVDLGPDPAAALVGDGVLGVLTCTTGRPGPRRCGLRARRGRAARRRARRGRRCRAGRR